MDFLPVSWQELQNNTFTLSQQIEKSEKKFDLIVAIARGGLTVAHILSDFLTLPVASFTVSSYKDMQQKELSEVSFQVGIDIKNKHVLLVDDVSDSGKTFKKAILYLQGLGVSSIISAAVFTKPHTSHIPDFSSSQTDRWIVFPYEIKETVVCIISMMKKENKTTDEIKNKLKEIKIAEKYINYYCHPDQPADSAGRGGIPRLTLTGKRSG